MKYWLKKSSWLLAGSLLSTPLAMANEFSASFKGTDIQEFINIVGRNLEKTIIVDLRYAAKSMCAVLIP